VRQLNEAGQQGELSTRLSAQLARTQKLDRFYREIDRGELLEFFEYDEQAGEAIEGALRTIGAWDAEQWWTVLPVEDLTPAQAERLREDVFRQLLLSGAIRAKEALVDFGAKDSAATYQEVLRLAQKAAAWRPSQSARVLEVFGRVGQGPMEALKLGIVPAVVPTSQADLYYVGLMQFWFGQQQDAVTKLLTLLRPFTGMDFTDSLANSERMLRTAVAKDPHHYRTWFFLGWTKLELRDYSAAELAFDACISLRPESAIGYSYRGLAILRGARRNAELKNTPAKDRPATAAPAKLVKPQPEEIARSMADMAKAEALDPTNPEIVYLHARGLALAERPTELKAALKRWLELEPPLATWAGKRIETEKRAKIADLVKYAETQTKQDPTDVVSWRLLADGAMRIGDDAAAGRAIDELLKRNAQDALGLKLREELTARKRTPPK